MNHLLLKMTHILSFLVLFISLMGMSYSAPNSLPLCQTCHGNDGFSSQNSWPHLAGQSSQYMYKQLMDMKNNNRTSPLMQPYAKLLSESEMISLSQYYAHLPRHSSSQPPHSRGEQLYLLGDAKLRVPACSACHGPSGLGNDAAKYPAIAQQNKLYLIQQLQAFKQHTRQNDPHHIMQDISERLSDEDIEALAQYLSLL